MIASRRLIFGKIRSCCFIRVGKLCIPLPLKCAGSSIFVPFFLNFSDLSNKWNVLDEQKGGKKTSIQKRE